MYARGEKPQLLQRIPSAAGLLHSKEGEADATDSDTDDSES